MRFKKKSLYHPLVTLEFAADILHVLELHELLNVLVSQVGLYGEKKSGGWRL